MKLYLELLANYKKQKKNVGNLISQLRLIIHQNNIQIDSEGKPLEELVDNFILSYMKLIDKLEKEEESRVIAECLVEEIIRKVESSNSLIPLMEKKIVQITNYCEENKKKPQTTVIMGN